MKAWWWTSIDKDTLLFPMQCIPSIMNIVLGRLTQESKTTELKNMCILVVSVPCHIRVVSIMGQVGHLKWSLCTDMPYQCNARVVSYGSSQGLNCESCGIPSELEFCTIANRPSYLNLHFILRMTNGQLVLIIRIRATQDPTVWMKIFTLLQRFFNALLCRAQLSHFSTVTLLFTLSCLSLLTLQVIAGLYYNPTILLEFLEVTCFPNTTESITAQLFKQWVKDAALFEGWAGIEFVICCCFTVGKGPQYIDHFRNIHLSTNLTLIISNCFMYPFRIHDRKMSILGLCSVLQYLLHSPSRPPAVVDLAPTFIPMVVTQLEALIEAYKGAPSLPPSADCI